MIEYTVPLLGRLPAIDVQLRPRSLLSRRYGLKSPDMWPSNAAYTVFGSCDDGMTRATCGVSGTPGKRSILRQLCAPFSDTWMVPSSVPSHSCPSLSGDSE